MTTYHMHIEVRGALKWPKSRLKGMFRNKETGKHLTPDEVRELLMDHLTEGHECIPCGPCDNFNHGKDGGCMGHNDKGEQTPACGRSARTPGCAAGGDE